MRGKRELARSQIWLASSWWSRMRGLLGRPQLLPGEGLKIVPCNSIHCFFMAVPIDVVFLDKRAQNLPRGSALAWSNPSQGAVRGGIGRRRSAAPGYKGG